MRRFLGGISSLGFAVAMLLLWSAPASATTTISSTTVTRVYVNSSGDILLRFASGQSGEGCTDNGYAKINTNGARWDKMFDVAMAAYLGGKTVGVRLSGCSYYPLVTYIFLK